MMAERGFWGRSAAAMLLACALTACGSPQDAPTEQAGANPPVAAVAAADGKPAVFSQCAACHAVTPGKNGIGPTLAGVVGRKAGSLPGFAYSNAMVAYGGIWDETTLDAYLTAPTKAVPGTKMSYGGLSNGADRKELIEYLKTLK